MVLRRQRGHRRPPWPKCLDHRTVEVNGLSLRLRHDRAAGSTAFHAKITAKKQPKGARLAPWVCRQEQAIGLQANVAQETTLRVSDVWVMNLDAEIVRGIRELAEQPAKTGLRFPIMRCVERHTREYLSVERREAVQCRPMSAHSGPGARPRRGLSARQGRLAA